jgi:hypothetical protein
MRRKRNPGWFKAGPDPRRHKLTRADRAKGYARALALAGCDSAQLYAWIWRRVRSYYRLAGQGGGELR